MAIQIVMDRSGDNRHHFNADDAQELTRAEQRFYELIDAGFTAAVRTGLAHPIVRPDCEGNRLLPQIGRRVTETTMFGFRPSRGGRSRMKAARALFIRHGTEGTPEGRSLRLLRQWLSPVQREQFARKGYFEVIGSDSGIRYRIHAGASVNVCEIDERDHLQAGLCFMPIGALPIGDVMLAQKIALETSESEVRSVARRFAPNRFHFRQARLLG